MYRSQLERKRSQRIDAEKKVGAFRKKEADKRLAAAKAKDLHRQLIAIDARPAATIADLMDGVVRFRPHVIHFAGHGDE